MPTQDETRWRQKNYSSLKEQQRNVEIRRLHKSGWSRKDLIALAGVTKQRIHQIINKKPAANRSRAGTVYVANAQAAKAIKIGVTSDVGKRLKSLQTMCPVKVVLLFTLPGGRELEADLHRRFQSSQLWGEWFRLTKEIKQFIKDNQPP